MTTKIIRSDKQVLKPMDQSFCLLRINSLEIKFDYHWKATIYEKRFDALVFCPNSNEVQGQFFMNIISNDFEQAN